MPGLVTTTDAVKACAGLKSASNERIKLTVVDVLGRMVEQGSDIPANSTLQIGNSYHPGIYFAQG